ncbi:hypothetical protein LTR08_006933 [Meristemomyces frigidus]|nr:hypothetical protein LTR08_006933 [Meristemomyces frigidus]
MPAHVHITDSLSISVLPSSPPLPEYDISIASASSPPTPRGRAFEREDQLLGPEVTRLPPPRTPASTRSRFRDNSSEYYTAAWGSPYEQTTSPTGSARTAFSEQQPSEEQLGSSPLASFGLEHLVPSRIAHLNLPRPSLSVLGRSVTGDDGLHTSRSRTQRWVQLPQRGLSERSPWLSDDSHSLSEDAPLHNRAPSSISAQVADRQLTRSHRKRENNLTLNQQSFLETLRDGEPSEMASVFASRWTDTPPPDDQEAANEAGGSNGSEKQLPDLPSEAGAEKEAVVHLEQWAGDAGEVVRDETTTPVARILEPVEPQKSSSAGPTPPNIGATRLEPSRTRKRVSWRGKACVISIQNVDRRAMGLEDPMTTSEVYERLKQFEDAGHSTRGFDLGHEAQDVECSVHVRPIYPDEADSQLPANEQRVKVSLPDLNKWRAYTQWLLEQKLAALGVSTGTDEPSLPAMNVSRQPAGQNPLIPFSPPIPTGSAGSGSASSMGRPGVVRGHSQTMSVASPLSSGVGPFGHTHRHSTFTGRSAVPHLQTQQLTQQQQQQQLPPFPGMQAFSPGERSAMSSFQPYGGLPAQYGPLRHDLSATRSPASPLGQQVYAQSPQDYSRSLMDDQRRRQHAYSQSVQQPKQYAFVPQVATVLQTPTLPELAEEDVEEEASAPELPAYLPPHKRAQINADVAVPTPTRGHQHNPSQGLEREVLEAEQRHEDERRKWIKALEDDHHHSRLKELQSAAAKAPRHVDDFYSNEDTLAQAAAHRQQKSAPRFNVSAPSFSFNPGASFQPASNAFTFIGQASKTNGPLPKGHTRQASSGASNVAAPAFQPADPSFSFSAQAPPSKSNPSATKPSEPTSNARTVVDGLPSIFGKLEIPDIVKPTRKSKAIAIVRPDKNQDSVEEFEDEEGRIAQSDDRLKRQRFRGGDRDEVPRFAEPTPMPDPTAFAPMETSLMNEPVMEMANVPVVQAEAEQVPKRTVLENVRSAGVHVEQANRKAATPESMAHLHKPSGLLSAFARSFEPHALLPPTGDDVNDEHARTVSLASALEDGEIREDELSDASSVHLSEALTLPKPYSPFNYAATGRIDQVAQPEPSFDEIDAVMRQLNAASSGAEQEQAGFDDRAISPLPDLDDHQPMLGVTYLPEWGRSAGPSPSPTRGHGAQYVTGDSSLTVHDQTDSGEPAINDWSQVHRLNKTEDVPLSDWSGMLSPPGEEKLQARSSYFDSHIEELLGRVVERRLRPLEESLRNVHSTVNKRARSSDHPSLKRSSSNVESDADDEDDLPHALRHRPVSRGRDKRADELKAAVLEALQEQSSRQSQSSCDIADLHSALADMKVSFARAASANLELDDIRAVVEDVLSRQQQALVPRAIEERKESHKRELTILEGRLNETLAGALEEANHRRATEEREAENRRLLRLAEEELSLLRDSVRDDDGKLGTLEDERRELIERTVRSEEVQRSTEEQVKSLEAENEAMQGTLEEYRLSSTKWRVNIDDAKQEREELKNTISALERQVEDGQESSTSMRRRLEKLHADMATAAGQLASEKAVWKRTEQDFLSHCEAMEAQHATQKRQRYDLEEELRVSRIGMAEASEARLALDHARDSVVHLDGLVKTLRSDLAEQQSLGARLERDFHDAKETGRAEVNRTRMSFETDVEAANHQVNMARAELESKFSKVRKELENVKLEAETAQARYERLLEEVDSAKEEALRKINLANSVALDEARQKHDAASQDLAAQHARAIGHAVEDKLRSEYILNERLALSAAKLEHAQDRILNLEERLQVAKSAAQAAVESVHLKAAPTAQAPNTSLPEKVSPQALRESILVLQEQLQEREARIERLQTQVDRDGPAQLRERDTEITWLRELLAVRNEDLGDLINTLSKSTFDRESVRDVAIRIRANLQMEQQEKERFSSSPQSAGGKTFASLSSFATPKAASLTSAFSKWRATMESSSLRHAPSSARVIRSSTPSRARPSSSLSTTYSEGLMTPPASNFRGMPSAEATTSVPTPRLHSRDGTAAPERRSSSSSRAPSRQLSASSEAPTTPLFREQSYDQDAEDNEMPSQIFEDDDLDIADSEPPAFRSLETELEPSTVIDANP